MDTSKPLATSEGQRVSVLQVANPASVIVATPAKVKRDEINYTLGVLIKEHSPKLDKY